MSRFESEPAYHPSSSTDPPDLLRAERERGADRRGPRYARHELADGLNIVDVLLADRAESLVKRPSWGHPAQLACEGVDLEGPDGTYLFTLAGEER